jgi:hypothetical protein
MMSFFGALSELLGDGLDPAAAEVPPAAAEVLPAAAADDPVDDFDVPLAAAGFDEVQATAPSSTTAAVTGRMRRAGHPVRTSWADRAL